MSDAGFPLRRAPQTLLALARVGASAATIVVVLCSVALVQAQPAAAGTGSSADLATTAAALENQIVSTAQQLHDLGAQTAAANGRLDAAEEALTADQDELAQTQADLEQARTVLRKVALSAYLRAGDSADLLLFTGSASDAAVSQTYEAVVTGSESDAVDRFVRQEALVAQQESVVESQRAAAAANYDTLSREDSVLQGEASSEQAMLNQVRQQQAQLAAMEAQQAAAAAAAATAARAAAARQGPPSTVDVGLLTQPAGGSMAEDLAKLRQCESGGNYQEDTGNGYYGAYQFSLGTWQGLGYSGLPSDAPPALQDQAAMQLVQQDGWSQWPVCSAMLGLG